MGRLAEARAFWAERLGCPVSALERVGLTLVPHPAGEAVYAFAVGGAVVVAAPESLHARLRAVSEPLALVTPEALLPLLPRDTRVVGPARIAYFHGETLAAPGVTRIESRDDPRLHALRESVTAEEWRHANLEAAELPLFAVEDTGELAAAAGFERLRGRVAHVGVLTRPSHRGRNLGLAVVRGATAHALGLALIPQYQTLAANTPALRIAERLGFEPFATTLSARFGASIPTH
jgi:RimJ/RimL family protein N-acetyltransferase